MPFTDRRHAGQELARLARRYQDEDTLVLGLARGGVPVAEEVAKALDAPLDVMVARKIGAPQQPEFGIGAVAPGDIIVVDEHLRHALGVSRAQLDQLKADEMAEMQRRLLAYRGAPTMPDVRGRHVILVDDGLATGVSARAAARALRAAGAWRVVLAVPVASQEGIDALADEVDDILCVETPEDFHAVGLWYDDFSQTTDEEVLTALARSRAGGPPDERSVTIDVGRVRLEGDLAVPRNAKGLVVFAHGSGSSRFSPRNRHVASVLQEAGLATLLLDLLTPEEEEADARSRHLRFDIDLLTERLLAAVEWASQEERLARLPLALFGSSTGAAAALIAAARAGSRVQAVVSRGGRADLADASLPQVEAAVLLVVGGADDVVLELNEMAYARLRSEKRLHVVPEATHLFEEPGALDEVARVAAGWFREHLTPRRRTRRRLHAGGHP